MKYKLIDVKKEVEEDIQLGTCELCEYIGTHYYDILVFQDEAGEIYHAENGFWSWSDYFILWHIDNYVEFADFISNKDYPKVELDEYRNSNIEEIVWLMYDDFNEEDENL